MTGILSYGDGYPISSGPAACCHTPRDVRCSHAPDGCVWLYREMDKWEVEPTRSGAEMTFLPGVLKNSA